MPVHEVRADECQSDDDKLRSGDLLGGLLHIIMKGTLFVSVGHRKSFTESVHIKYTLERSKCQTLFKGTLFMDEKKPLPNQLKMPEGVSSLGPVESITEAYVKAVVAIPEMLEGVLNELATISDSMAILALYAERQGKAGALFTPEDEETIEDLKGVKDEGTAEVDGD